MVEGESGILAISPRHDRPEYEPSKRRLTWPNGAQASTYSADEPERLRGPQHDAAWCDEVAAWRYPEAWTQLMLGLRLGLNPRAVVTTTPKPVQLIRELVARVGRDVVITRGRTLDNAANLAPAFLDTIIAQYQGTRIGRQELDGELLEDVPGALWQRFWLDRDRISQPPPLVRIVVGVDPAISTGEGSDETGIVVAGSDQNGNGYVLEDYSGRLSPEEWARRAINLYKKYEADRIVAEQNQGGDMVENTLRMVDRHIPIKLVHASRGKLLRAEPVSALYEQGKIHHVGSLPILEDQMCSLTSDFDRRVAGYSPDRVDALVWALTELLVTGNVPKLVRSSDLTGGEAIPMPKRCFYVATVLAVDKLGTTAVIYLARLSSGILALDYNVEPLQVDLFSNIARRANELARECGAMHGHCAFVPADLVSHAEKCGLAAYPIPEALHVEDLILTAAAAISSGKFRLAGPAVRKTEIFPLAPALEFRGEERTDDALRSAVVLAIALSLDEQGAAK
jgi:predicted phage terminase large subunit-like protein